MTKVQPDHPWQRAIILLTGTVVALVTVLALQWGRPVLVPVALATLLTFLLNPIVKRLQRIGLQRLPAVIIAVTAVAMTVMTVGWVVSRQVGAMLDELPRNTANLVSKARAVRQLGSNRFISQFSQMVEEIDRELHSHTESSTTPDAEAPPATSTASPPVVVRNEPTSWPDISSYLSSAMEVFVTLAFALVLLVFFLLSREDLRDRVVMLAGKAHLALTSKALEEVTDRISRYIVMVALVNGGFGLVLTGGLLALQVPYALLWGLLAAALRFIPYIGPWLGAIFPIVMSLAVSDG